MPDTIVTQLTALYAALVSTGTAAWTIYKDRKDIGKLKVTVGFRSIIGNGTIEENLLVWTITNVGKRSIVLIHAAGTCEPKPETDDGFNNFLVTDPHLPKRLEPGDYHMSICREYDFSGPIKRLSAIDSLNRNFSASSSDVGEVNKKLKALAAKGITRASTRGVGQ